MRRIVSWPWQLGPVVCDSLMWCVIAGCGGQVRDNQVAILPHQIGQSLLLLRKVRFHMRHPINYMVSESQVSQNIVNLWCTITGLNNKSTFLWVVDFIKQFDEPVETVVLIHCLT